MANQVTSEQILYDEIRLYYCFLRGNDDDPKHLFFDESFQRWRFEISVPNGIADQLSENEDVVLNAIEELFKSAFEVISVPDLYGISFSFYFERNNPRVIDRDWFQEYVQTKEPKDIWSQLSDIEVEENLEGIINALAALEDKINANTFFEALLTTVPKVSDDLYKLWKQLEGFEIDRRILEMFGRQFRNLSQQEAIFERIIRDFTGQKPSDEQPHSRSSVLDNLEDYLNARSETKHEGRIRLTFDVSGINYLDLANVILSLFFQVVLRSNTSDPKTSGHRHAARASQGGHWGGGGPGGWPFPLFWPIPQEGIDDKTTPYYFHLPESLEELRATAKTKDAEVTVAILDSLPFPINGTDYRKEWSDIVHKFPKNQLIQSLDQLHKDDKLSFIDCIDKDRAEEINCVMDNHGLASYYMADHGLFVAGIIHSIAPHAKIKIYRVLTDKGNSHTTDIGDAYEQAIEDAKDDESNPRLIICCSLTMMLGTEKSMFDPPRKDRLNTSYMENEWRYRQTGDMSRIPESWTKISIVAASGNEGTFLSQFGKDDWLPNYLNPNNKLIESPADGSLVATTVLDAPPYPWFPAAFERVLGVSALDEHFKRASYSNWADDFNLPVDPPPPAGEAPSIPGERRGIATYGGEILEIPSPIDPTNPLHSLRITDPFDSLLGLYVSDYQIPNPIDAHAEPIQMPNTQGWVYWSGTSFATPIVVGALAILAVHNPDANSEELLQELLKYCEERINHDTGGVPLNAEHVLKVSQGRKHTQNQLVKSLLRAFISNL